MTITSKDKTKRTLSLLLRVWLLGIVFTILTSVILFYTVVHKSHSLVLSSDDSVYANLTEQSKGSPTVGTFLQRIRNDLYEVSLSVEQYLTFKGYIFEEHYLNTDDGYILKMIRLQSKNQKSINPFKRPLYLSHGILCSYELWLINSEELAPAFVLANAGVDLWLGSFRGTEFSRNHSFLNPNEPEYWDFSWEQMATYDLSASIKYIHELTRTKVSVGGHSQGGLALLASLAEESLPLNIIDKVFLLGPGGYMKHFDVSLVNFFLSNKIHHMFTYFGFQEEAFPHEYIRSVGVTLCHILPDLCMYLIESSVDLNAKHINKERIPYFAGKIPYATSIKNILHFTQLAQNTQRKIYRFDYGEEENVRRYGSSEPKSYNLSNIRHPVYIFAGLQDRLSNIRDIRDLHQDLPNATLLEYEGVGHVGFLLGTDLSYLYDMIQILYEK